MLKRKLTIWQRWNHLTEDEMTHANRRKVSEKYPFKSWNVRQRHWFHSGQRETKQNHRHFVQRRDKIYILSNFDWKLLHQILHITERTYIIIFDRLRVKTYVKILYLPYDRTNDATFCPSRRHHVNILSIIQQIVLHWHSPRMMLKLLLILVHYIFVSTLWPPLQSLHFRTTTIYVNNVSTVVEVKFEKLLHRHCVCRGVKLRMPNIVTSIGVPIIMS